MTTEHQRHLSPLVDALRIHASIEDARAEQTGGDVWCAVGTLPNGWGVAADAYGFTFTDADGHSRLIANHYESGDPLTVEDGRIDSDEADAAAVCVLLVYRQTVEP